jgi:hypothetical protein
MNVLMIGVDKTSIGGMLTVVENYLNNEDFCRKTNLKYIATVIRNVSGNPLDFDLAELANKNKERENRYCPCSYGRTGERF